MKSLQQIQEDFRNAVIKPLVQAGYQQIREPADCALGGIYAFVKAPSGETLVVSENGAQDWHTRETYRFEQGALIKNQPASPKP